MLWDRARLVYRGGLMCRVGDATLSSLVDVEEIKITFRLKCHAQNIVIILLKIEKETNIIYKR